MVSTISMDVGETRNVQIAVSSTCCTPFEVNSATWELRCGDEVDESGDCGIESNPNLTRYVLTALIKPQRKNARYLLRFTYEIQPETFIYDVVIRVS